MGLELHPAAIEEAGDAYVHYFRGDADVGERFLDALEATFDAVIKTPLRFPKYAHGTHRAMLRGFPFQVIFALKPDGILILAVAHHHRKPGFWATRVGPD